jgi:hypothetical protein
MPTTGWDTVRWYRIVVEGELGDLLAHAFAACRLERRGGRTVIWAPTRDETEFYSWLERCRDLALHVVSVTEMDAAVRGTA